MVVQISKNKQYLPDSDDLCFECGNSGHWAKRCPRRRARHLNSNNNNNNNHNSISNNTHHHHNNNNNKTWETGRNAVAIQRKKESFVGSFNSNGGYPSATYRSFEECYITTNGGSCASAFIAAGESGGGPQFLFPPPPASLPSFTPPGGGCYDYLAAYPMEPYSSGGGFYTTMMPQPQYVLSLPAGGDMYF